MAGGGPRRMHVSVSRKIYKLMSLTGAGLSEALCCWKAARGDFPTAVQLYEEKFLNGIQCMEPPSDFQEQKKEEKHAMGEGSLSGLWNPGAYFVKGVLMAAAILVAVESL